MYRVVLLASVLGGLLGLNFSAGWHWLAPKPLPTEDNSPAAIAGRDVAVTYNNSGIAPEAFARYAGELAVTDAALSSFFKILEQEQVPRSDLDNRLREIAKRHNELLRLIKKTMPTEDSKMLQVQEETQQAIKNYSTTTPLSYLEERLRMRRKVIDRAGERVTLSNIGAIYQKRGEFRIALVFFIQSLSISREIGDKVGEGVTLNSISLIYATQGDYEQALKYLEQSLSISQEIGDRRQEGITSWNIGMIYKKQGNLSKAEQYMSRAVQLAEEIGHPELKRWRKALEELRAEI